VAKKRKKKSGWLKVLLLFMFVPVFVWGAAFLIWLNWNDLKAFFGYEPSRATPAAKAGLSEPPKRAAGKGPQETILDEDRRQLEDILKRK